MKKIVPAMDKADKIFMYLYKKNSSNQSDIARELDIPKATASRLLSSLVELNYLTINNKEYSLGNKFDYFSDKKEKYSLVKNIALPYLEELSLRFKETFKISILDKDKIRAIASVESSDFHKISVTDNSIFPLHAGAASKLLICQMDDKKLNRLLPEQLPKYTENTIINREELKKELFKINIKKISFDNNEHSKDICAVATPIMDKSNTIIAAISCPYFSPMWSLEKIEEVTKEMFKACNEITKRLNYFNNLG
ncbi:IclR family transcriptional regulator [Cetobacterium sp. 2A]|uniref:IclR family transcriptional regulator n=1 Tax=unclassified Cetobacterium TaxID=2630983 RepID=UPI00163CAC27|nr:IclR family transcriptional regulator [Cetobacterium sp. 2A]MBC2857136.1 IclR family transcriptional regulator [Cetobacterium sp. 2A]